MHLSRPRRALVGLGTAIALMTTGGVATAAKPAPPKPFLNTAIVIQHSIGGIALNESVGRATRTFGKKLCMGGGCVYTAPHNAYTVQVIFVKRTAHSRPFVGSVTLIGSASSAARRMHTSKGIGLGSSTRAVRKAYPKAVFYNNGGGYTAFTFGKDPNQTAIALYKGRVREIDMHNIGIG